MKAQRQKCLWYLHFCFSFFFSFLHFKSKTLWNRSDMHKPHFHSANLLWVDAETSTPLWISICFPPVDLSMWRIDSIKEEQLYCLCRIVKVLLQHQRSCYHTWLLHTAVTIYRTHTADLSHVYVNLAVTYCRFQNNKAIIIRKMVKTP